MSADQPQPPNVCSLQPNELSDRRAVWERLLKRALRHRRTIPSGMRLVFVAEEGVEGKLRELAERSSEPHRALRAPTGAPERRADLRRLGPEALCHRLRT